MQKLIIAALVTAIVMLGSSETHGQWYFSHATVETEYVRAIGLMQATLTFRNIAEITVDDLYYGDVNGRGAVASGSNLTVGNFYVTTGTLARMNGNPLMGNPFTGNGNVQNFWLQIGGEYLEINGVHNPFGVTQTYTSPIILTGTSVQAGSVPVVSQGTGWLRDNTNFGVNVTNSGTVNNLTMTGGTVNNAGRIDTLTYGGGSYYDLGGTVGRLTFNGSGLFTIAPADGGGFAPMIRASEVNLANARIQFDLSSLDDWFYSWEDIFGTTDVIGHENAFFSINWDGNVYDFDGLSLTVGRYDLIIGELGVTGTHATPEPATLAIISLGLAGLGWARRRQMMRATAA